MTLMGHIVENPRQALIHFKKAYDLFESLNDRWYMAGLQFQMGAISSQILADREKAIYHIETSLPIFRELGFKRGIIACLNRLSAIAMFTNETEKMERYLQESMQLAEELKDQQVLGLTVGFVGFLYIHLGKFDAAHRTFNKSLAINEDIGQSDQVIHVTIYIARTENFLGRYQEALERLLQIQKDPELENNSFYMGLWLLEYGRSLLGEGDVNRAYEPLQASVETFREREDMTYLPNSISILSIWLYRTGDCAGMIDVMQEALQIYAKIRRPLSYIYAFPALALLQLSEGRVERATEFYAYAVSHPSIAKSQWYKDLVGCLIEQAAESLPPDVVAAAEERGRKLDPEKVIEELLLEMEAKAKV